MLTTIAQHIGDLGRRGDNDRQIDRMLNQLDRRITLQITDAVVLGVNRENRPLESSLLNILQQQCAHAMLLPGGTDNSDGFRFKYFGQIVLCHLLPFFK